MSYGSIKCGLCVQNLSEYRGLKKKCTAQRNFGIWPVAWLGWMVGWLVGRSVGWLDGLVDGWLVGW